MAFPLFIQHDGMLCGIACLKMICKHYGRDYSMDTLAEICSATNAGVSLLSMSEASKSLGLKADCMKVTIDQLNEADMPCILHWNQNHFVVLYKVSKGRRYYVADPSKGKVVYTAEELIHHWQSACDNEKSFGIAMFLSTTPEFFDKKIAQEHTDRHRRTFRFLFDYIARFKQYFGQILLGLIVASLLQLALPFLTQSIVDIGIKNQDIGFVWLILLGQLVLTFSRTALDFIRRWLLLHISMRINILLVSDFLIKLLRLPMSFFDTRLLGDLVQRMSDHNRINAFLTQKALTIAFAMLTFLVFSIVLLLYNSIVFSIFISGSLMYGAWMTLFLRKRKVLDYELFEQQARNNNKTYEFITSMQEIKLQNCERRRRWEWEEVQTALFNVQMKSLKLQQTQEAGCIFINELKNMVITVVAATAVINGQMTLGMMLAVQFIIGQLNSPVEQMMEFFYSLQDVKISLDRINEVHEMKDENRSENLSCELKNKDAGISLNHIMFKYDAHALRRIIDDVTLQIPHGKVIAIVGASGSGKSTLVKLMLGYYPVLEGAINIGGTNINQLNKKWWRQQCGVVMQNGVIFNESIARNIAIDDGDIDEQRLTKAAEIACINDFVMSLPLKYNTKIGDEGVGLSQGQKQRILIARAVYKNPDYIFLDEATNSLDANNERRIVEHLKQFYQGRTVVIIAHRLSTVKDADQIVVLHQGRIVETGSHNELTARQGAYYNLVRNQLELGN